MPAIFLSYRRDDSSDAAGRPHDRLQEHFGRDAVFVDVDSIPLGVDFRQHLGGAVARCDVLLAVLGDRWLGCCYEEGPRRGRRRLDDPADFVRVEIEAALARGIPVIPVLVGRAAMPREEDLPDGLKPLAYRNAAEVRGGPDFRAHVQRLIRGVEAAAPGGREPARPQGRVGPGKAPSLDDLKRQFVEEVKLRAADGYVGREGEREVLAWSVQRGLTVDSARAALAQVCETQGYVLESQVLAGVRQMLCDGAGGDGVVGRGQFNVAVALCRQGVRGKKILSQVKRMVVQVVEESGFKARQGFFDRWYDVAKREAGL